MQPVPLECATHHEHVAFAGMEHDVRRVGAGGDLLDDLRQWRAVPHHERPPLAEHHDCDNRVVEPSQLPVAVQALEVTPVAVEDGGDTPERHPIPRRDVETGLAQQRLAVGA